MYSLISPGGVQSNVRFWPRPIYFSRASGSRVWSIDGVEFTDFINGYGSIILGHNDPVVREFIIKALDDGLTTGLESELNYKVVDLLHSMIPSAEAVRLSVTGTEAVMHALMIARAATGRRRIIKVEGGYHGWYDQVLVSYNPPLDKAGDAREPNTVPDSDGLFPELAMSTIVVPYNDPEALRRALVKYRGEVAAFIIEPVAFNMGAVLPKGDYLKEVREITEEFDVLLIFDEVITGFRLAPGGAQEYFGVKPDLSVFGKAMGNGFPISAVVGRADLLKLTEPGGRVSYAGTYNGNYVSVAAAYATLMQLRDGSVQSHLNELSRIIVEGIRREAELLEANVKVYGIGGQFQVYFTDRDVVDYRTAKTTDAEVYRSYWEFMMSNGQLMHPNPLFHHGVTKAHTRWEAERFVELTAEFIGSRARRRR